MNTDMWLSLSPAQVRVLACLANATSRGHNLARLLVYGDGGRLIIGDGAMIFARPAPHRVGSRIARAVKAGEFLDRAEAAIADPGTRPSIAIPLDLGEPDFLLPADDEERCSRVVGDDAIDLGDRPANLVFLAGPERLPVGFSIWYLAMAAMLGVRSLVPLETETMFRGGDLCSGSPWAGSGSNFTTVVLMPRVVPTGIVKQMRGPVEAYP